MQQTLPDADRGDGSGRCVVIVGGGVTGLTAARELSSSGLDVVVLEKSHSTGGMCRSRIIDGVVFDAGPHVLLPGGRTRGTCYIRRLLKGSSLIRRRYRTAISDGSRFWRFPASLLELLRYPSWAKASLASGLLPGNASRKADHSLEGYIRGRVGSQLYERVFAPAVLHKLGVCAGSLHRDWWLRPHTGIQAGGSRRLRGSDRAGPVSLAGEFLHRLMPFYLYPPEGIGRVPSLLRGGYSGRLVTDCGEISLSFSGRRITGVETGKGFFPTDHLVWTAPISDFYASLGRKPPAASPSLTTMMVYATFTSTRRIGRRFLYTYHHGQSTVFNRICYPASVFGDDSPGSVEGFCFEVRLSEETGSMSAEGLADRVASDARRIGVTDGKLVSSEAETVSGASPVLSMDYVNDRRKLFSVVDEFGNLVFAGKQGTYCYCLIQDAVDHGLEAADCVMSRTCGS